MIDTTQDWLALAKDATDEEILARAKEVEVGSRASTATKEEIGERVQAFAAALRNLRDAARLDPETILVR